MRQVFAYTVYAAAGFIAVHTIGQITEGQHWAIVALGVLMKLVAITASLLAAFMALVLLSRIAIDEGEDE